MVELLESHMPLFCFSLKEKISDLKWSMVLELVPMNNLLLFCDQIDCHGHRILLFRPHEFHLYLLF